MKPRAPALLHDVWRYCKELKYRLTRASKTQVLLDVANVAALGFQFWATVHLGIVRYSSPTSLVSPWVAWTFFLALIYSTLHRLWLKEQFEPPKWVTEEARRASAVGVAISRLASCTNHRRFSQVDFEHIERGLLTAMLSEMQAIVLDSQHLYLNVTLLIEHRHDPSLLFCLNRAVATQPMHRSYGKDSMAAWEAMTSQRSVYWRKVTPPPGRTYQCIFALPILTADGDGLRTIGAISIDSEREGHFDELEAKIVRKLMPYQSLLELVLVLRERYNSFPKGAPTGARGDGARVEPEVM